jgi:hypothetical protein
MAVTQPALHARSGRLVDPTTPPETGRGGRSRESSDDQRKEQLPSSVSVIILLPHGDLRVIFSFQIVWCDTSTDRPRQSPRQTPAEGFFVR